AQDADAHSRRRSNLLDAYRVIPAKPLVHGEEVGLTSKKVLRRKWPADRAPKAVVMETGNWGSGAVIVIAVGIKFVIKIILISAAVPFAGTAFRDDLYLCTRGAIEVGS